VVQLHRPVKLPDLIAQRAEWLTRYQNEAYARQYTEFVEQVRLAEQARLPGQESLTRAVAQGLYKLMAYKDEYEVARLHSDPVFLRTIGERFEGDYRLRYHLAPPLLARRNDKGELEKRAYGPWMMTGFKWLARLRFLRGTVLDPFGYTEERRTERALIGQYRSGIESLLATLGPDTRERALAVARWPESIKGFGHVKERHLTQAQTQWAQWMK
jgi:indolepyruvate ferredoxin oxidoreductase